MTYIIADPCVSTCDTACVEVCPVDCIHGPKDKEGMGEEAKAPGFNPEGKQLYINPDECIDCGACEPECPVEAIFPEEDVPEEWNKFYSKYQDEFGYKIVKEWAHKVYENPSTGWCDYVYNVILEKISK